MPLTTITATLDNTLRCTFNELCSQQSSNITTDASISFTTLLTAGSTLLATVYAAASSSIMLSSIKLYSFYSKQRLLHNQLVQSSQLNTQFNSTFDSSCDQSSLYRASSNTSPTQSEIVSITGALIVFTVLLTTVLLTHLFDAIDDFTRKCCKIKLTNLVHIGIGKVFNQLILDLLITIVLKSTLLTSLFVDEKSLKLTKKLNYDSHEDSGTEELDELLRDDECFATQRKWSTWFAGQLRKRLVHS